MAEASALLGSFLDGTLDLATFRHVDHVQVGYELLERHDFPSAAALYCSRLKQMTEQAGLARVYHETITLAFLALIAERRAVQPGADFHAFTRDNPELLDKTVLNRWYSPERMQSDTARRTFILPEACR